MMVIETLAKRFPQLYLKPQTGVSQSELYRAIVRKGYRYEGSLSHFTGSAKDSLTSEQTPAGEVTVVLLGDRADFECATSAIFLLPVKSERQLTAAVSRSFTAFSATAR